jgi:hypothetical protein
LHYTNALFGLSSSQSVKQEVREMANDPKRNVDRHKIPGVHLNEFEFHKAQAEMAEEFGPPTKGNPARRTLTQAERVKLLMEEAHRKVVKKRKHEASLGKSASTAKSTAKTSTKSTKKASAGRAKQAKKVSKKTGKK